MARSPADPSAEEPVSDPVTADPVLDPAPDAGADHATVEREVAGEQAVVDVLYARLDVLREETAAHLDRVRRTPTTRTPQAVSERDAFDQLYSTRLDQLRSVEDRLCFGRLDLLPGTSDDGEDVRHVGRVGLSDGDRQILVDWRAPAAEPFYQATSADPRGVVRRRHLSTRGRTVTAVEDEVLDLDALGDATTVAGEGALLVALNAARTGRMRDIVATIQAEQDRVVRSPLDGVLVVQGGPGTGKTAVALHRAAYLLYTHRARIARSGVLVIGPNRTFLRYIEQVLPSLGETGVVMATPATLYPGVDARGHDSLETAAVKGDLRIARAMVEAVRRRQRVPRTPVPLDVDGLTVVLRPADVEAARGQARRSRQPHNAARVIFVKEVLRSLARQLADVQGVEWDNDTRRELDRDLRESLDVKRAVNRCWLPYTPQRLLSRLLSREAWLAELPLSDRERRLLLRAEDAPFTPADVPLLDELGDLLGVDDTAARADAARAARERAQEREYARGVLEMASAVDRSEVAGGLLASDVVDAERMAERWGGGHTGMTVAERAADDRDWAFGHVVVDEAQELSPMQWRMIMRRIPSRSLTVVGDIAQTGSLSGASSWGSVFEPYAAGRWRVEELTVNYRTPAQVMDVAADVLAVAHPGATIPESARVGDWPPVAIPCAAGVLADLAEVVRAELDRFATVAVIAPDDLVAGAREALSGLLADDGPVDVYDVASAKGLEFDVVVLLEPARIVAASERGYSDLYVAMTRPTQRLIVLHAEPLPDVLRALS